MKLYLALILVSLLVGGCAPCSESCTQQAAVYDVCLASWGLEWGDLGATDREDFRYRCIDSNQLWVQSLDDQSASSQKQLCTDLATDLRGETDCEEAWEALISYGVEP